MTDLPEIVTRAMSLHTATAADLSLFGGVLRCGTCHGEQPVGDVASHLGRGWPKCCGLTMTWVTAKQLAAERWGEIPDGHELVAVPDDDWRIDTGRRCRRAGARQKACGKPSAASLQRGKSGRWAYCLDHSYSRWIEGGKVMHWILREKELPRG